MDGLDQLESNGGGDTVFRDVIMLALAGFMAAVLLLLPHLNPPTKTDQDRPNPGNLIVEIRWPDELDADVDLWVQALDARPVGYSNKGGTIFNLLRDDLGQNGDLSELNYEVTYSRGIPSGAYVVNLHLYRNKAGTFPIPVSVVVSLKRNPQDSSRELLTKSIDLNFEGEEITAFRFEMDEQANVVPGSVHDLPKALRSGS